MATLSPTEMVVWLEQHQFLTSVQVDAVRAILKTFPDIHAIAKELVQLDWLTPFQVNQILQGKHDQLILGDYRLRERIGDGAMGQVYKAWSLRLQRVVALKTIHKDRINSPNARHRFRCEVQAAAQLAHPNIALVRDADEENNRPFLVMDYIEGINLSVRVKQHGAVPIQEAAEYIRQAALGLQHAFERGVVHRDIKPANLMVVSNKGGDGKPVVKILDFGLARYESEQEPLARVTQVGNLLGTVDYVAPEQAQNARGADIRADIYSLGCTLFYLLTAKPPFDGETVMEKLSPRITGEAPWVRTLKPDVPPGLEDIVRKMMARSPDDRYQTPIEVAQALAPFAGATMTAVPVAPAKSIVLATPVGSEADVPMAMPILAQAIESSADLPLASRASTPLPPRAKSPGSLKWVMLFGIGFVLLSVGCLGACFFFGPSRTTKNASIVIKDAKLSTPSQTVKPGDTKFVLIHIERVNFDGPVTISLENLPAGVEGKSKTIPANSSSADVSFTVSHGTDPITTNIRIVAACEAASAAGERSMPFTIVADKKAKK